LFILHINIRVRAQSYQDRALTPKVHNIEAGGFIEIFFIVLFVIFLLYKLSGSKGAAGERKVRSKLKSLISKKEGYYLFNDLTLETPDGTTQIDHILISRFGIFVIETKNYKGWIFGSANQKQWTQTIRGKKYKFQNPIHQNYKHIKAVENLLDVQQINIFSVIVFVGDSQFKTEVPSNVIKLRYLVSFLGSYTVKILSDKNIEGFSQKLNNPAYSDSSNNKKHVNNLKRNSQNSICPRCGKKMVLRTSRKGKVVGSKFWGCSGYPVCRATKRVA
jgi:restriction system protein